MENYLISKFILLLCVSSIFGALNKTDITINDIKNALPDGVTFPPEFADAELPNIDDAKKLFKDKCIKVSGSDAAYEEVTQATTTVMDCIQNLVNFSSIPDEIERAKPNGNIDTVFNKYCLKRGDALDCIHDFTESIDPCLTAEEKEQKVLFMNISKTLLEFICHENGNHIALFIAEEGPECFSSKQDELQDCFNITMGKYFNNEMPTIDNLPSLVIKEENCIDMDKLEACVVKELEKCKESTPANLMEALFRFVRKETPCKQYLKTPDQKSDSNIISIGKVMIVLAFALTFSKY
ncbi:CLUMA_CG020373, isoform A [Clunio marinus]|uniref:CLUMA_CG020373, isoform A n=1 Tax=Clunio marinus TaxID=568069 RepID=A0A1J1J4R8_9DIPT|nr:CLUMA_CG020373, isoform A [Clunio marinus]